MLQRVLAHAGACRLLLHLSLPLVVTAAANDISSSSPSSRDHRPDDLLLRRRALDDHVLHLLAGGFLGRTTHFRALPDLRK